MLTNLYLCVGADPIARKSCYPCAPRIDKGELQWPAIVRDLWSSLNFHACHPRILEFTGIRSSKEDSRRCGDLEHLGCRRGDV